MSDPGTEQTCEAGQQQGQCGCCYAGVPLFVFAGAYLGLRIAWRHGLWARLLGLVGGLFVGYVAAVLLIFCIACAAVLRRRAGDG